MLVCAYLPGVALVVFAVVLQTLSTKLAGDPASEGSARTWLTVASMLAGAIYLATLYGARATGARTAGGRRLLAWTLGSALVARGLVCFAPPLLETDFYRYMWDGAVTAHGINPYAHTPESVLADAVSGAERNELRTLAESSGAVLPSVNHPHLSTVYPPLAQLVFALAHAIDPFGVVGLRLVLFAFDALTVLLLARWLRALSLPIHHIAWYVSNPLLLREVYSALHMDVLVLPFLVGAGLLVTRRRYGAGALVCALGAAVKLWPLLLLPLFLRPLGRVRRAAALSGFALVALALAFWVRAAVAGSDATSGFVAYGGSWQNNDGFFRAGIWLTEVVLTSLSIAAWHSHAVMRVVSTALIIGLVLGRALLVRGRTLDAAREFLLVGGAIFLLSPTQFPWYWLWLLPLLAVRPSLPLLLYVVLLPLYELQDPGTAVYWVEHLPVWGLLAVSVLRERRTPAARGA